MRRGRKRKRKRDFFLTTGMIETDLQLSHVATTMHAISSCSAMIYHGRSKVENGRTKLIVLRQIVPALFTRTVYVICMGLV